jgi:hypothetical protein
MTARETMAKSRGRSGIAGVTDHVEGEDIALTPEAAIVPPKTHASACVASSVIAARRALVAPRAGRAARWSRR